MKPRVLLAAVGAAVATVALATAGAGAAIQITDDSLAVSQGVAHAKLSKVKRPNLTTLKTIKAHLRRSGISMKGVVIQRGARNYAGPNCPGKAWKCTKGRGVVLQIMQAGQNQFECTPSSDPGPTSCTVVQVGTGGKNHARCTEKTTLNPVVLTCNITQTNVGDGDNFADVLQQATQTSGAIQDAQIDATVDQFTETGDNHMKVTQVITQKTSQVQLVSEPNQLQDGTFTADLEQDTEGGKNHLDLTQDLDQTGTVSGSDSSLSQEQNGDHEGGVHQDSTFADEESSFFSLFSAEEDDGQSQAHVRQSEKQTLTGPGDQEQNGPMGCCEIFSQFGDPQTSFMNLSQSKHQKCSGFKAGRCEEDANALGEFYSDGTVSIHHNLHNEADHVSNHVSGQGFVALESSCFAGEGEGGPEGFCESGPPESED